MNKGRNLLKNLYLIAIAVCVWAQMAIAYAAANATAKATFLGFSYNFIFSVLIIFVVVIFLLFLRCESRLGKVNEKIAKLEKQLTNSTDTQKYEQIFVKDNHPAPNSLSKSSPQSCISDKDLQDIGNQANNTIPKGNSDKQGKQNQQDEALRAAILEQKKKDAERLEQEKERQRRYNWVQSVIDEYNSLSNGPYQKLVDFSDKHEVVGFKCRNVDALTRDPSAAVEFMTCPTSMQGDFWAIKMDWDNKYIVFPINGAYNENLHLAGGMRYVFSSNYPKTGGVFKQITVIKPAVFSHRSGIWRREEMGEIRLA